MNEKTLKDTTVFDGRLIRVHVDDVELDNGVVAKREIVSHPGGVTVAILTEQNELIFVKQFRCPYKEVLLELPAGKLEPGEDPFEAMKREQLEEKRQALEVQKKSPVPVEDRAGELVQRFLDQAGESRELLVSLIERVELTKDKEIIIKFRFAQMGEPAKMQALQGIALSGTP